MSSFVPPNGPAQPGPAVVDLRGQQPPEAWGVRIDLDAVDRLAARMAAATLPSPGEGMATLPSGASPDRWADFFGISVSVLACLWAPDGEDQWTTNIDGTELTDAPAFFSAFARFLRPTRYGYDMRPLTTWTVADTRELFAGHGVFQLIPERHAILRDLAQTMLDEYDGSFLHLIEECGYDAERFVAALVDNVPGYNDISSCELGQLRFEKLPRLATAMIAGGLGGRLSGLDEFPVYPDYMLPKVFRHHGIFTYDEDLAMAIDTRQLVPKDSHWEYALRWGTVWTAERVRERMAAHGSPITGPRLDFALWHSGVLGPDAGSMGEHHRTLTMKY
jgi:hypothetical protein